MSALDREVNMQQRFWDIAHGLAPFPVVLEPDVRYALTQALGGMMSAVSEETYAAQWLIGLEDALPPVLQARAVHRDDGDLGEFQWQVTVQAAEGMVAIAALLGHWTNYEWYPVNEGSGEQYIPYRPKMEQEGLK